MRDTKRFLDQIPPELQPTFHLALVRFQLGEMSIHGPSHWLAVLSNATTLANQTSDSDLKVCQLFALLHDCERQNEGSDLQHGPRAANYIAELHRSAKLDITEKQLQILSEACSFHADGRLSSEPTIAVCWDADRLDLPRVGARVNRRYLSTDAAKRRL